MLAAQRAAGAEQLIHLTRDFDLLVAAAADVATDDEHDPEGATSAFERAQVIALRDQMERRLADVDAALTHLADGSYGRCERCGERISPERLAVRPAARHCLDCAAGSGAART